MDKVLRSLEDKTLSESKLKSELKSLKKQHHQTISENKHAIGNNYGTAHRLEKELWSVTAEKKRYA